MKTLFKFFYCIFLFNNPHVQAQVTVSILYHNNRDIETNLYGFHMSNFFEQCICYDPVSPESSVDSIDQCMSLAASLKPKVVRFPAGGDHKFMHLLDDDGYGYREQDIDEFVDLDWLSPTAAAPLYVYIDSQTTRYNDIRFIDRFIDFLDYCEDENGFKPDVIFVANIILGKTTLYTTGEIAHENLEAMRYLMANGVKISGIELGNEHYDDMDLNGDAIFNDGDEEPSFLDYLQTCDAMLDSLDYFLQFDTIPVSLLAAPEPIHGAESGLGATKIGYYEDWNEELKAVSTPSISTSELFDAYTVHIYNRPDDLPECYKLYYDDYVKMNPNDEIGEIDDQIIPAWECAQDSFRNYTTKTLQTILNNYAGTCTSCLGNAKPYWITEWGIFGVDNKAGVNYGYSKVLNDTIAGNFGDTFIDAAYAFQYLLEMMDYESGLDGVHNADIDFMIKHNFVSRSIGGSINYRSGTDPKGTSDPWYIRRANYWPFYLIREIFKNDYERVNTTVELLDSETRTPFIKCFYYDNPASIILPENFCTPSTEFTGSSGSELTGGTINPVFYMYYYNPYPDDITFKHEEIIGYDDPEISFTPTSNQAAFKKYFRVLELYEHGGINQYMKDNSFYNSLENVSPDINGISSQVYHLCEGDSIVLNAYSIGYVYWEITPTPNREGLFTENTTHKVWPVPAEKTAYIQLTLPNEEDLYTLNVFSLTGELVQQKDFSASGYDEIQRENLSSGMYFYSIINQTGFEVAKGKMIWE